MHNALVLLVPILFLTACHKNAVSQKTVFIQERLPIVIDAHAHKSEPNEISYRTKKTREAVIAFYKKEMERDGWQRIGNHHAPQKDLIVFYKPTAACVVEVTQHGSHRTRVLVTTMPHNETT